VIFAHLGYSFPSGHSFFALVVYGMLAYWLTRDAPRRARRWGWALAVGLILLVGFSRVFLGEHYPSDVAAGYAVALPWLWGCLALPTAFHRGGRDVSTQEAAARSAAG
jgi:membrane-associated phospholipid phosphatase